MNSYLSLLILGASPLSELRGAIPFGLASGISLQNTVILAILANLAIIPALFLLLRISKFRSLIFKIFGGRIEKKIEAHRARFELYGELALILFVAVPLPLTGAYTGVLISEFLGYNRIKSGIAIALGVMIAGILVTLASVSVISLF